ncbi:hypothetical protein GOODEAATRI_002271 [Goodea atripinnis]|uniref:RING-type domain-containing protein n=1 Tax=Goodea atripinnis TaxID=208336 RepID=A0ABV0PK60_9TELE
MISCHLSPLTLLSLTPPPLLPQRKPALKPGAEIKSIGVWSGSRPLANEVGERQPKSLPLGLYCLYRGLVIGWRFSHPHCAALLSGFYPAGCVVPWIVVQCGELVREHSVSDSYTMPLTSIQCWHVHCEECWLRTLGNKKLCPQCNTITSPGDLRRVYL